MARIVEPRPVDLRALRAKRAARQMEAGQVALAAGKRLHGLDALAILDVDSRLRVDQRGDERRDRVAVRRMDTHGAVALREPPVQVARHFGGQRAQVPVEPAAREALRIDDGLPERRQRRPCRARFRSVPRRCTPRAHAACPTRADKTALSLARPAQCCPCRPRVRATARHPTGWPHGLPCRVRSDTRRIRCESIMYSDFLLRPPNLPLIVGRNQSERSRDAHYMNLERI